MTKSPSIGQYLEICKDWSAPFEVAERLGITTKKASKELNTLRRFNAVEYHEGNKTYRAITQAKQEALTP